MKLAYPATVKKYRSHYGVSFTDVPEAVSAGKTEAEALANAEDALVVALSGYLDEERSIPAPARAAKHQPVVSVPPHAALKLAVHQAMIERGITQRELARLLDCDDRQVRRILDVNHESRMSQVEAALVALGLRAFVDVEPALAAHSA